ncbi:MAG: hypothetical protein EOL97_08595 [Spirochaetia bacterium]|nr:hypothetical protein [Spirochaetia bacterium]
MIIEPLVTYETALLASKKGFSKNCNAKWYFFIFNKNVFGRTEKSIDDLELLYKENEIYCTTNHLGIKDTDISLMICAPTQSLLQKWLRDKYRIDIQITRNKPGYNEYRVEIYQTFTNLNTYVYKQINEDNSNFCKWFSNYEDALEEGLLEGLKLIKDE